MKGKIDENGCLHISRCGTMVCQDCALSNGEKYCGDTCPLFGEPYTAPEITHKTFSTQQEAEHFIDSVKHLVETDMWEDSDGDFIVEISRPTDKIYLCLCHTMLKFDEFTDERRR
jgi:hypothetical protein